MRAVRLIPFSMKLATILGAIVLLGTLYGDISEDPAGRAEYALVKRSPDRVSPCRQTYIREPVRQ